MTRDDSRLAWTGVLGSALMLAAFVLVGGLGLPDTSSPDSLLRYPAISTARIVENTLYLSALVLMAIHTAALSRTLWRTSPAAALSAATAGLLGSGLLVGGALIHLGTAPFADLLTGTPSAGRDAVVATWLGAQVVFDTLLVTGALVTAAGLVVLAWAGRRMVVLVIAVAALLGAAVAVAVPGSPAVAAAILGMVAFHAVAGGRAMWTARQATQNSLPSGSSMTM